VIGFRHVDCLFSTNVQLADLVRRAKQFDSTTARPPEINLSDTEQAIVIVASMEHVVFYPEGTAELSSSNQCTATVR
jgi:hypothetical protein